MGEKNPRVVDIDRDAAQSFINVLRSRSNAISTIRRRVASIKALLNTTSKRYDLPDWDNPFNKIDLPRDDGDAGEDKRRSLTFDDIRKIRDHLAGVNDDARDIWHLMLFTGLGPSEARGLMWSEVFLDAPTPHFEVRPNGARRRLKRGERRRRVPLVGSAIKMMAARKRNAEAEEVYVFPRYAKHANANTLSAVLIKPMKVSGVWQTNVKVPYSLRHTLKDLLRRKAPVNMQLLLLGHGFGEGRVASGYGEDDLLDMQAKYLVEALSFGGFIAYPEMPSHGAKPR
jgi:integrase